MTMDRNTLGQIQSRRRFLEQTACGLGGMALWQLMADDTGLKAHFAPRAKNVIFLFMPGGPSQLDLLDPKPVMKKQAHHCPEQKGRQTRIGGAKIETDQMAFFILKLMTQQILIAS